MISIRLGRKKTTLVGSVVIILNERDDLLILRRPPRVEWAPNKWALPGGKIEEGESPLAAAIRETSEETNLKISHLKPVGLVTNKVITSYYTRNYVGFVKLDHEHDDWAWAPRTEIEKYDLAPGVLDTYDWVLKHG